MVRWSDLGVVRRCEFSYEPGKFGSTVRSVTVTQVCIDDLTLGVELGYFGESVRRTFACLMPAQRMDGHIVAFRSMP